MSEYDELLQEIIPILQKIANVGGTNAIVEMANMQTYLNIKAQEILAKAQKHYVPWDREKVMRYLEKTYGRFVRYGSMMPDSWESYGKEADQLHKTLTGG